MAVGAPAGMKKEDLLVQEEVTVSINAEEEIHVDELMGAPTGWVRLLWAFSH